MNVVIVESPAKAKTIGKYLGDDYVVLASFGHVRDLIPKDGSVLPEKDFELVWQEKVDGRTRSNFSAIVKAVRDSRRLILATDPDREGEAIAWHVLEMLKKKRALKGVNVARISFNAITRASVTEAMSRPRALDQELIDAYLARRALDYLVGYNLSPVLWRKLPGSRSAGRVQSVALRLICDRELEIEAFQAREYWSIEAQMYGADTKADFPAAAIRWNGKKLEKFSLADEESAKRLCSDIESATGFRVSAVESKEVRRNPSPPFITSSLQQEASRKLGFPADRTMHIAQRLYEGVPLDGGVVQGLITYMRTDGVQMAPEAVTMIRAAINRHFGADYLPERPRMYKSKAKNAQEAHEAIRPVDPSRHPDDLRRRLSADEARLYELIWKRAVASQMESARLRQTRVDMDAEGVDVTLRSSGSVVLFDGFLRLYRESTEREEREGRKGPDGGGGLLPALGKGDPVQLRSVRPQQHFTEPPPRFTEASLVKKMEELGIGRPSTYASTLSLLRDRGYVHLQGRTLIPDDRGRLTTAFLAHFFARYLDYHFTAQMEENLDSVSAGNLEWKQFLGDFWHEFHATVEETIGLRISDVLDHLNEALAPYVFARKPDDGADTDPRTCRLCGKGRLSIKLGRTGAFVGCSGFPECDFTRPLSAAEGDGPGTQGGDILLGTDPESGQEVMRKDGQFGPYLQLGKGSVGKDEKPRRVSVPAPLDGPGLTLERALALLALPRKVGDHPENGEAIMAGIGRYGPYLRFKGRYTNLEVPEDVLTIGLNHAVALLAKPRKAARANIAPPLRELGKHPDDGENVNIMEGRYGLYVKHGKKNASLPRGREAASFSLEEAVELLAAKAARPRGRGKPRSAAKTAAKSTATAKEKLRAGTKKKTAPRRS